MQQSATPANPTLNDVKRHFEHWRATRAKRCKIPDFLWDEVKSLIGRYPTNQIAQALRVNAYQISTSINNKNNPDITFVRARPVISPTESIKPAISCPDSEQGTCSLEIHRANGGILKIS